METMAPADLPPADSDELLYRTGQMSPEELQYIEWWENYRREITSDGTQYSPYDVVALGEFMAANPNTNVQGLRNLFNDIQREMDLR